MPSLGRPVPKSGRPLPVAPCCRHAGRFVVGKDRQYWGYRRKSDGYVVLSRYDGMGVLEQHTAKGDKVRGPFVANTPGDALVILGKKLKEGTAYQRPPSAAPRAA